jgi:hypothetical protein
MDATTALAQEIANLTQRAVPARVTATQELRRSNAAARHTDRRKAASRKGCRGKELQRALREQGYR